FKRLFKASWQSITRNWWLSIATVLVVFLSVLTFTGIRLFAYSVNRTVAMLQDRVDISIYFNKDVPESEIFQVQTELEGVSQVKNVKYVSQDEALKFFQEKQKYNPAIFKAIEVLGTNPLSPSLSIKAKNDKDYQSILDYISKSGFKDRLITVNYEENQKVVQKLDVLNRAVKITAISVSILLVGIAVLINFNTIRLAIYTAKDEIRAMKLVGAPNWFVRGPFLFEGTIYGITASVLTLIVVSSLVFAFSPKLESALPGLGLGGYYWTHLGWIFLAQTLFGVVIGLASSFVAMNKYLES
ncbi:MAG TPA: permease-like cell division protein FtsX, partial [Candidatus Paceibacterota bacterium]|nr:permease-like cell division protein FtsX [Candidatus Paceibacterota bacterium]